MTRFKMIVVVGVLALVTVAVAPVYAVPIIDGKFDPAEGYTERFGVQLNVEGLKKDDPLIPAPDPGEMWCYQDPVTNDLSLAIIQPLSLVDNTYGANSIGWGTAAPSGKNHNFKDLVGSDKIELKFTDGLGATVLHIVGDYINEVTADVEYRTGGVTGTDGDVIVGSASDVLAWGTSLDYNFNTLNHDHAPFFTDSPLSVPDYTDPPAAPGWIFEVIYEMKIDGDVFGAAGLGDKEIVVIHDSPNKIGKNKVHDDLLASLGDYVWLDLNLDGVQDGNETGIDGVTVDLFDGLDNPLGTTTTSGGGLYGFIDLVPGDYYVKFTPPPGFFFSPQDQGGDDLVDGDEDPVTGMTIHTTLVAGENDLSWDAGLFRSGGGGGVPEPAGLGLIGVALLALRTKRN
ncbi:MAG: SdrD B-like domain-containing protein [Planctomycetota bacterium]